MLNPRAEAPAANPDGRRAPEVSLDEQMRWCRTGTRGSRGRIRQETGLLVLFGVRRQGYSTYLRNASRWTAYLGNVGWNRQRLHSALGYRTPVEARASTEAITMRAAA